MGNPAQQTGRMIGVLVARTPDNRLVSFAAISGWSNFPPEWEAAAAGLGLVPCALIGKAPVRANQAQNVPAQPGAPPAHWDVRARAFLPTVAVNSNAAGQCAGPKLILTALRAGYTPLEMTEVWWNPNNRPAFNLGAQGAPGFVHNGIYSSCATCQINLTQMLCDQQVA